MVDSLNPLNYRYITMNGRFKETLKGIASEYDLKPEQVLALFHVQFDAAAEAIINNEQIRVPKVCRVKPTSVNHVSSEQHLKSPRNPERFPGQS